MKVDMNGLRRNMGRAQNSLYAELEELFDDLNNAHDDNIEAVKKAFNDMSFFVGSLYCISNPKDESFSNLDEETPYLRRFQDD